MRGVLTLTMGVIIGQWLAFGALPSPAEFNAQGLAAWERRDYTGALHHWSEGLTVRPHDPLLHYRRGTVLAALGQWHAASEAYRLVLFLKPPAELARLAQGGLARLQAAPTSGSLEATAPLEPVRGVWVTTVLLNGARLARFLVDTGSSVTIVAPALARDLSLPRAGGAAIELQTVGGPTAGPLGTMASIRVGAAEQRDVPVVVHDPGPGIEGILGNSFLARYRVTVDAQRRLLTLAPAARD